VVWCAAGCVYTIVLDEEFNAVRMQPLVCGRPRTAFERMFVDPANQCDIDGKMSLLVFCKRFY
jgi:hypothetical protein